MVRMKSPCPGSSTLMTSAPRSASSVAAKGAPMRVPRSSTRMPANGPAGTRMPARGPAAGSVTGGTIARSRQVGPRERVEVVVARALALPAVLGEAALASHAEPLERARRALVLDRAHRLDADQAEVLEAEADEEPACLGRIPLPPVRARQAVAHLGPLVPCRDDAEVAAADDRARLPQRDRA